MVCRQDNEDTQEAHPNSTHPYPGIHTFWAFALRIVMSCWAMTDSTSMSMRLNSSKQHQAPDWARPEKNLPIIWNMTWCELKLLKGYFTGLSNQILFQDISCFFYVHICIWVHLNVYLSVCCVCLSAWCIWECLFMCACVCLSGHFFCVFDYCVQKTETLFVGCH